MFMAINRYRIDKLSDEQKQAYYMLCVITGRKGTDIDYTLDSIEKTIKEKKESGDTKDLLFWEMDKKRLEIKKKIIDRKCKMINKLFDEYSLCAERCRLDNATVNFYQNIDNFDNIFGRVKFSKVIDIDHVISSLLKNLGYNPNAYEPKNESRKMHSLSKKIRKKIENLKIPMHYSYFEDLLTIEKFRYDKISDLFKCVDDGRKIFDTIICGGLYDHYPKLPEHNKNIVIKIGKSTYRNYNINLNVKDFIYDKKYESFIPEIAKINHRLETGRLNPYTHVRLEKALFKYKEYEKRFISYQIIAYYLNKLNPMHKNIINKLEKIVKKEEIKCEKLIREADKLFYSVNLKETDNIVEKEIEKEEINDKTNNKEINNIPNIEIQATKKEKTEGQKKEQKMTEIELKNISSGIRTKYVEERMKNSELGKLSYSKYIKKKYPNQIELIEYIEQQEKVGETLYKEYLKDVQYRKEKNLPVIKFRQFVEIKTKQSYYESNIELPIEIEKELKEKGLY